MKYRYLLAIPALIASVSASAAKPAEQTPAMDMRCFLVIKKQADAATAPEEQQQIMAVSMFYIARLSTGLTLEELKAMAIKQSIILNMEGSDGLLKQCGTFARERIEFMKTFGKELKKVSHAEIQKVLIDYAAEKAQRKADASAAAEAETNPQPPSAPQP